MNFESDSSEAMAFHGSSHMTEAFRTLAVGAMGGFNFREQVQAAGAVAGQMLAGMMITDGASILAGGMDPRGGDHPTAGSVLRDGIRVAKDVLGVVRDGAEVLRDGVVVLEDIMSPMGDMR